MSLEQLTMSLTTAFAASDFAKCATLLTPIKRELVKHALLIPSPQTNPSDKQITQSILEIGALVSLNLNNLTQFEHYITQLKLYYEDPNAKSENKNKLMGLYLLYLLTKGDLALFHIELEKFDDIVELEEDIYLNVPIKFEQWIIDGDFHKINDYILNGSTNFPSKEFQLFESDLLNSIRVQIAQNLETSYKNLKLENLKLLLFLKEVNETNQFIENFNWDVKNGIVYFNKGSDLNNENDEKSIIKNTLIYAREMESII